MNYLNMSFLSNEFINGNLHNALNEASQKTDKQVYITESGIQALSINEAKLYKKVNLISLPRLERVMNENMKKLHPEKVNILSKTLSLFAKRLGTSLKLNELELKKTAETEGFGYKKANLDQINNLCHETFGDYSIQVPAYVGIPSNTIQNVIKAKGLDIAAEWKKIIDKHFPSNSEKKQAFNSRKFPENFLNDCACLREKTRTALKLLLLEDDKSLEQLFDVQNLDKLIQEVQKSGERFMVRSTGKEDTKELANAGGNTSVANVLPVKNEVLNSLIEVVISYIGEKSFKQRLGAGDVSLFDPIPFTPVLIQRMIGERNPSALPKCGVMFTEDSESAIIDENGHTAHS